MLPLILLLILYKNYNKYYNKYIMNKLKKCWMIIWELRIILKLDY